MPTAWCQVGPTAISRRMRRWRTLPADAAHPRHLSATRWPGMLVRTCAKRVRVLPHGLRAVPWGAWLRHKSRSVSPQTAARAGAQKQLARGCLEFGRIVASEIDSPNTLLITV